MKQVCVFDVDGTLLDSMKMWENLAENYLISLGSEPEIGLSRKLKTFYMKKSAAYLREMYQLEKTVEEIVEEITGRILHFYQKEVRAKRGVKLFLEELHRRNIPMYVATASERSYITEALEKEGLLTYIKELFTCSELNCVKDEPRFFQKLEQEIGMEEPTGCRMIVFEDSLQAAKSAKKNGNYVIGIFDESAQEEEQNMKEICDLYWKSWQKPEQFFL